MRVLLSTIVALFVLQAALPAVAQDATGERNVSQTDLEKLVETIENEKERADFLVRLKALLAAEKASRPAPEESGPGVELLQHLSGRVDRAGREIVRAAESLLDLPNVIERLKAAASRPEIRVLWLGVAGKLLLVLVAGLLGEWLMRSLLRRPRDRLEGRVAEGLTIRAVTLLARTVLDVLPIGMFAAAAYVTMIVLDPDEAGRLVALALINASVIARAIVAFGRLILVPRASSLRLLPIRDEAANYAFLWICRLANTVVYGYFVTRALDALGFPPELLGIFVKLVGLAVALLVIMVVLQNREAAARLIGGGQAALLGTARRRLADVWHILAMVYVLGVFGVWALDVRGGFDYLLRATLLTVVIVLGAVLIGIGARRAIGRAFALNDEIKGRFPGIEERANRYLPIIQASVRWIVTIVAVLALLQAWGTGIFEWLSGPTGRDLLSRIVKIAAILFVALLAWELISATIARYLSARTEDGNTVTRSRRIRTLLPLARNASMIVIGVLVILTVLTELGVEIGPLLAGAGIVGLAVGFGAQTLVKDVITGFFIVLEDSVAIGDVVTVAGQSGIVEAMSIRSIRLRDLEGIVRRIPFSEVTSIVNMTKEFSYALFDIGVAYRENVDEVVEVMKEVAATLRANPDFADDILEDIEILGLDRFADSAVVVRGRIKTKPIKQWGVRREYNRLLKQKFDELGIEIPFPHQTIYFGEDKAGNAPPANVRLGRSSDAENSRD